MLAVILSLGLAYQSPGEAVSDDRLILRILDCWMVLLFIDMFVTRGELFSHI